MSKQLLAPDGKPYWLPAARKKAGKPPVWNVTRKLPDVTGSKTVNKVVLHTSEQKPDFNPPDHGAEWLAQYAASTTRNASWHANCDADSTIYLLPPSYRAWHVHRYSWSSLGVEMATKAHLWDSLPDEWVDGCLTQTARLVALWCREFDIPPVLINRKQVDAGEAGITYHGWLDPARRSDPGVHGEFPKDRFFTLLRRELGPHSMPTQPDAPQTLAGQKQQLTTVERVNLEHRVLERLLSSANRRIPWISDMPTVRMVQRLIGVRQDGIFGDNTKKALRAYFGWGE